MDHGGLPTVKENGAVKSGTQDKILMNTVTKNVLLFERVLQSSGIFVISKFGTE